MSFHGTCNWHHTGVPPQYQREPWRLRWFVPGCPACIAKWAGRDIPADVLAPEQLAQAFGAMRPKTNWNKRHRGEAVRKAAYLSRTTPRAA